MSAETYQGRVRAVMKTASRYVKPKIETFLLLTSFLYVSPISLSSAKRVRAHSVVLQLLSPLQFTTPSSTSTVTKTVMMSMMKTTTVSIPSAGTIIGRLPL